MILTDEQLQELAAMFPQHNKEYIAYAAQSHDTIESAVTYLLANTQTKITMSLQETRYNLQQERQIRGDQDLKGDLKQSWHRVANSDMTKHGELQNETSAHTRNAHIICANDSYNYPGLFAKTKKTDTSDAYAYYRAKAQEYYKPVTYNTCVRNKNLYNAYYAEKIEENIEKAKYYDHKAAEIILSKQQKKLDFHNLRVSECIEYLQDYIQHTNPHRIEIVTGKSKQIKPKITQYLEENGYKIETDRVVTIVFVKKQ